MNQFWTSVFTTSIIAVSAAAILMPLMIRWSPMLRLVDMPNERKLHRKPIPAIGGMVMMLSMLITYACSPQLRQFLHQFQPLGLLLVVLSITGVVDDRLNLPASLRLIVQLGAAAWLAASGIRLQDLHGFMGIHQLPLVVQYILTIIIVAGVTNAFNLIDGIDGLAGSIALVNVVVFIILFALFGQMQFMSLLLPMALVLIVFIRYNWRPARLFMGDGGSLVLGFLFAALGIIAFNDSWVTGVEFANETLVAITATMMLAVLDTLRVFYVRAMQGRSPFAADKNHLHHLFVRQHLSHAQATLRVIKVHVLLIGISILLVQYLSATATVMLQVLLVLAYTRMLHLSLLFQRWYRFVKRLEMT